MKLTVERQRSSRGKTYWSLEIVSGSWSRSRSQSFDDRLPESVGQDELTVRVVGAVGEPTPLSTCHLGWMRSQPQSALRYTSRCRRLPETLRAKIIGVPQHSGLGFGFSTGRLGVARRAHCSACLSRRSLRGSNE